jgi:hypothetical protein
LRIDVLTPGIAPSLTRKGATLSVDEAANGKPPAVQSQSEPAFRLDRNPRSNWIGIAVQIRS